MAAVGERDRPALQQGPILLGQVARACRLGSKVWRRRSRGLIPLARAEPTRDRTSRVSELRLWPM
jgi:hypothetical protein